MLILIYYFFLLMAVLGMVTWLIRYIETFRSPSRDPQLKEDSYDGMPSTTPFVSIVIPARNEERNIGQCLSSLVNQDYPHFEIIVVNDRSTDKTREIVEELQKKYGNISLINNTELVQGWTGKNFAINKGIQIAKGDWYLFTDADTCHHPKSLRQAVHYVLDKKVDMLTLLPMLEGKSLWEKIIQPIAGAVLLISFPIKCSNDPKSKTAFANGQYILINKNVYNGFSGHEGLKEHFLEDIAMAKAVKYGGGKLNVVISPDLYKTRMYKNLKEIWHGWSRIFYFIYDKKVSLIMLNIILLFLFSILPILTAVYCGAYLVCEDTFSIKIMTLFLLNIVQIIFVRMTTFRYYRLSRLNPYYSILNPIGCVIMIGILLNAIKTIFSKKGMTWRGTTYAKT